MYVYLVVQCILAMKNSKDVVKHSYDYNTDDLFHNNVCHIFIL